MPSIRSSWAPVPVPADRLWCVGLGRAVCMCVGMYMVVYSTWPWFSQSGPRMSEGSPPGFHVPPVSPHSHGCVICCFDCCLGRLAVDSLVRSFISLLRDGTKYRTLHECLGYQSVFPPARYPPAATRLLAAALVLESTGMCPPRRVVLWRIGGPGHHCVSLAASLFGCA